MLEYRAVPEPVLTPGGVLVGLEAIGLNFANLYRRRGHYHLAGQPPYIAGYEGAGRVVALAQDVTGFRVGDRARTSALARAWWLSRPVARPSSRSCRL